MFPISISPKVATQADIEVPELCEMIVSGGFDFANTGIDVQASPNLINLYSCMANLTTYPYARWLAGPEIVEFGDLNGPPLPQHPLEKMWGEAPYLFQ